jgi:hypothetical protein
MDMTTKSQLRASLLSALNELDGSGDSDIAPPFPREKRQQDLSAEPTDVRRTVSDLQKTVGDLQTTLTDVLCVVEQQRKEIAELRLSRDKLTAVVSKSTSAVDALRNDRKHESHFQRILQNKFQAEHKHIVGVGVTDITTDDAHIEIKRWKYYDDVTGQLAKYQRALARPRSCVYYFGRMPNSRRLNEIFELMAAANIEVYWFDEEDDSIHSHQPVKSAQDLRESMERQMFTDFTESHIVEEKGSDISWKEAQKIFISWVEGTKQPTAPTKPKAVKSLFIKYLGPFVDNNYQGKNIYGWRHYRLINNTGVQEESTQVKST